LDKTESVVLERDCEEIIKSKNIKYERNLKFQINVKIDRKSFVEKVWTRTLGIFS